MRLSEARGYRYSGYLVLGSLHRKMCISTKHIEQGPRRSTRLHKLKRMPSGSGDLEEVQEASLSLNKKACQNGTRNRLDRSALISSSGGW